MLIFPDIEKTLVAYFKQALEDYGTELAEDVRVATKHSQPDETTPAKQIVIVGAYNQETPARVTRDGSVTIDVYADDYETASALGLLVEALVRGCTGDQIKKAEVRLGPVRTTEESTQERRSLDVLVVIKGTDI